MNTIRIGHQRTLPGWCVTMFVVCFLAVTMAYGQTTIEYQMGAELAKGFDLVDETVRGECVSYEGESDLAPTSGGFEHFDVMDKEVLSRVMNISAAASYKTMFGTRVEGKLDFAKNQSVTQFAHSLLVRYIARTGGKTVKKPKLKAKYVNLAKISTADFREKCGNYFILGIATGGEFYGFLSIQTNNLSEQEKLATSISGSYGLGNTFSASADLSTEAKKELAHYQLTAKGVQTGGKPESFNTAEAMVAKWKGYPEELRTGTPNPSVLILQDYQVLDDFPEQTDLGPRELAINDMMVKAWHYQSILDDIEFIMGHKDQFYKAEASVPQILALKNQIVSQYLKTIREIAAECFKGAKCESPSGLPDPWTLRDQLPDRYKSACGRVVLPAPPPQEIRLGKHIKGDGEMKGHNPRILLDANLVQQERKLMLKTKLNMRESKSDWTEFDSGWQLSEFFNLDNGTENSGCVFDQNFAIPSTGQLKADGGKDKHNPQTHASPVTAAPNLVMKATCVSDTSGNDDNELYCNDIQFSTITIQLKHKEDVAGPAAFTASREGLRRRHLNNQEALKALELQGVQLRGKPK
jgi:hypothetical protein